MTKTVGKHCFNIFDLIGDTSNLNPAMVYPEEWFGTWQCIRLHYSLHRFGDPAIIRLFPLVVPEFQPFFRLNPVPVYILQAIHIKENVWTCFVHLYPPKFDSLWTQFSAQIAVGGASKIFGSKAIAGEIYGKFCQDEVSKDILTEGGRWGNRSCAIPVLNYKVEYQSTQD